MTFLASPYRDFPISIYGNSFALSIKKPYLCIKFNSKAYDYMLKIREHMEREFDDTVKILVFPDMDSKKVVVQQITKVKGMRADELESLIQRSVDVLEKIE